MHPSLRQIINGNATILASTCPAVVAADGSSQLPAAFADHPEEGGGPEEELPSETATLLRQYGEQSPKSELRDRISTWVRP